MEIQTLYQEAIKFASAKHAEKEQKVPGTNLPYDVHISNVAMEILISGFHTPHFDTAFAVQVALLHDTIEDTATDFHELEIKFGIEIAKAVSALSKNQDLPEHQQMQDSLNRIKELPSEVWAVKLADRITNLQPPPSHWDNAKKISYHNEAQTILEALGSANAYLASRLSAKMIEYQSSLLPEPK
jgi:guanosine-3',5'-bis(diphosphate) 3'-pyrophosphohydrolase